MEQDVLRDMSFETNDYRWILSSLRTSFAQGLCSDMFGVPRNRDRSVCKGVKSQDYKHGIKPLPPFYVHHMKKWGGIT